PSDFAMSADIVMLVKYTLSLPDAFPICLLVEILRLLLELGRIRVGRGHHLGDAVNAGHGGIGMVEQHAVAHLHLAHEIARLVVADRKSTRLNSSHVKISYAVFCLKKKNI